MLLCKSQLLFTKTILIKKQHICHNTWVIWIFGPLGIAQLKLKILYIKLLAWRLCYVYQKNKKLWLSKINSEIIQFKTILLGLHKGFSLSLKIVGVGYKILVSTIKVHSVQLHLGYSHSIEYNYSSKIKLSILKRSLKIWSCNKQQLYQIAFFLHFLKKPDLYKGKGLIPYNLRRKLKPGKKSKT